MVMVVGALEIIVTSNRAEFKLAAVLQLWFVSLLNFC